MSQNHTQSDSGIAQSDSSAPQTPADAAAEISAAPDVPVAQTFAELNLSSRIVENLNAAKFFKPTPIQAQFIPLAMTGRDVMGQAKTGTGKTAAFVLPIFEKIKSGQGIPQAIILAPTRELALQIQSEIDRLGGDLGVSSVTLYGGASYEPQIDALARGVDIIVGTPGRVMDHMRSHRLNLTGIKIAVLDEADRMLDLGFRKDIEYIMRHCPVERQTLLLSATIADDIKKLAKRFMRDPLEVWTSPESITVDAVEQQFFVCERSDKLPILLKLLDLEDPPLAIVFCATKIGAKKLAEKLKRLYIPAREIHGDLQQSRREKIMGNFRTGKVRLLIATDVASRGIDVQNITHIFNYDIPYKIEDYVHRIGRTGRMEKSGKAYTFVTREEGSYLTEIEQLINKEINRCHFDDLTSKWWPNPPKEPPPDFEHEVMTPDLAELAAAEGGGRGGKSRHGGRSRGGESRRGSSSSRTGEARRDRGPALAASRATESASIPENAPASGGAQPGDAGSGVFSAEAGGGEAGSKRRKRGGRRRRAAGGEPCDVTCAQCGTQTSVHFKPDPQRPVYCDPCYSARKAAAGSSRAAPAQAPSEGAAPPAESAPTSE
jgi:ATP-dependent RNA helicase DeaD